MAALDDVSLVRILVNAGFKDDGTLRNALAVVFAESGARCDAHNTAGNRPPSTDRGLFQINSYWHREVSDECAYDCPCNARAAYRISNGGTNWHPWSTWPAAAQRHYPDADRALTAWRSGGHGPPGEKLCTVTWDSLRVRTGPSTASQIVATYARGTVLNFVEVVQGETIDGNPHWGHSQQNHYYALVGTDHPNG